MSEVLDPRAEADHLLDLLPARLDADRRAQLRHNRELLAVLRMLERLTARVASPKARAGGSDR